MSFLEIGKIAFGERDDLIDWMKSKSLLSNTKTCNTCNVSMTWQDCNYISNGHRYVNNNIH